jgi:hypothetical protein
MILRRNDLFCRVLVPDKPDSRFVFPPGLLRLFL